MKEKHFTTIYDKDNAALTTAGVAGETPWLECWDSALCVADGLLTDPPTFENALADELGCGYPNMCAYKALGCAISVCLSALYSLITWRVVWKVV